MYSNLHAFTTKHIKRTALASVALIMVSATLLQPFAASAETTAGSAFQSSNNQLEYNYLSRTPMTRVAYYESCSIFFQQCVDKNGKQSGSIYGTSRCLDCMNKCNEDRGWFPWHLPGCSV
jgi:hypothetical protein